MKAIAVIDKNRAIGRGGKLLFRLPSDLDHFKKETIGRTIIMGRKTLDSMPGGKPLPGRSSLVLSKSLAPGVICERDGFKSYAFGSLEELEAFPGSEDAIICGGASIYGTFLGKCDELILTEVLAEAEDADAWFPEFRDEFELSGEEGPFSDNGYTYYIRTYVRKQEE